MVPNVPTRKGEIVRTDEAAEVRRRARQRQQRWSMIRCRNLTQITFRENHLEGPERAPFHRSHTSPMHGLQCQPAGRVGIGQHAAERTPHLALHVQGEAIHRCDERYGTDRHRQLAPRSVFMPGPASRQATWGRAPQECPHRTRLHSQLLS